jgi:hypothetical protein
MSTEMDGLVAAVTAEGTVVDAAVTAFQGLAQQITDAAGDRQKSLDLATEVNAKAAALAAAIPQNTPAQAMARQRK